MRNFLCFALCVLTCCSCPDEQRLHDLEKKKADWSQELEKMQKQKLDSASGEDQLQLIIDIMEVDEAIDQLKRTSTCL